MQKLALDEHDGSLGERWNCFLFRVCVLEGLEADLVRFLASLGEEMGQPPGARRGPRAVHGVYSLLLGNGLFLSQREVLSLCRASFLSRQNETKTARKSHAREPRERDEEQGKNIEKAPLPFCIFLSLL